MGADGWTATEHGGLICHRRPVGAMFELCVDENLPGGSGARHGVEWWINFQGDAIDDAITRIPGRRPDAVQIAKDAATRSALEAGLAAPAIGGPDLIGRLIAAALTMMEHAPGLLAGAVRVLEQAAAEQATGGGVSPAAAPVPTAEAIAGDPDRRLARAVAVLRRLSPGTLATLIGCMESAAVAAAAGEAGA